MNEENVMNVTYEHLLAPPPSVTMNPFKEMNGMIDKTSEDISTLMSMIIRLDPESITYIKNPTEEMAIAAVEKNWRAIRCIENPSEKTCMVAVLNDGMALQYIKNPSDGMIIAALFTTPAAIKFVDPYNPRYNDYAKLAFDQDHHTFESIVRPSKELAIRAIVKDYRHAEHYINNATDEEIDESFYMDIITTNPHTIQYLKQNREICMLAVTVDPKAIIHVNKEFIDDSLCITALRRYPDLLSHIPTSNQTYDVCMCAFETKPSSIMYVKEWTSEMVSHVIKNCPMDIWDRCKWMVDVVSFKNHVQYAVKEIKWMFGMLTKRKGLCDGTR